MDTIFDVLYRDEDEFLLIKVSGRGKSVFNSDWVLDDPYDSNILYISLFYGRVS